jgi:hypothetical protein
MKKLNSFLVAVVITSSALAQAPKYSNEFLSIGVGARALGMSNSNVVSVNDVTAGYWNPAGLLHIKTDYNVALMHAQYFAGIAKYDYAGFAKRIDSSSVFSVNIIRFGVDNIPNTTELIDAQGNVNYDRITTFTAADYAFMFSYARKLKMEGLKVGASAKIIRRKVGDFAGAWGFGIDAGAQYEYKKWNFGLMLRDVTTTFNAWSFNLTDEMKQTFIATGNEIPDNSVEITLPKMILGAARKWDFKHNLSLMAEANFDFTFDGKRNTIIKSNFTSIDPHGGFEFGYNNLVFLRMGVYNLQQITDIAGKKGWSIQPNFGLGVKIKRFSIDYALTDIGDASVALYSNIFSVKIDLDKKKIK